MILKTRELTKFSRIILWSLLMRALLKCRTPLSKLEEGYVISGSLFRCHHRYRSCLKSRLGCNQIMLRKAFICWLFSTFSSGQRIENGQVWNLIWTSSLALSLFTKFVSVLDIILLEAFETYLSVLRAPAGSESAAEHGFRPALSDRLIFGI